MAIQRFGPTFKPVTRTYLSGLQIGLCQAFRSNIRGFHATLRRPFVNECLVQTYTLINGIHGITGLPWAASIPLTTLLTRALIIFPLDYYGRKIALQQRRLAPSMREAVRIAQQKVAQTDQGRSAREKTRAPQAELRRALRRLRAEHGLQTWKTCLRFVRLPIWLVVMETLRRMAGAEQGMLGLVWKSTTGGRTPDLDTPDVAVISMENSFVAEGMLWFPNLLLPDPSLLLPFILSATLLTSAAFSGQSLQTPHTNQIVKSAVANHANNKAYPLRMRRLQKALALAAAPATLQFPSAMTLYWISSGLCSVGSKIILNRWMPFEEKAAPTKMVIAPAMQQFRGPTMQDLRNQKKKQKQEQKKLSRHS